MPKSRSGKDDESPVIQREAERPSEESHAWAEAWGDTRTAGHGRGCAPA